MEFADKFLQGKMCFRTKLDENEDFGKLSDDTKSKYNEDR